MHLRWQASCAAATAAALDIALQLTMRERAQRQHLQQRTAAAEARALSQLEESGPYATYGSAPPLPLAVAGDGGTEGPDLGTLAEEADNGLIRSALAHSKSSSGLIDAAVRAQVCEWGVAPLAKLSLCRALRGPQQGLAKAQPWRSGSRQQSKTLWRL